MVDLLSQLITVDPVCRISCAEALDHHWIQVQEEQILAKEVKQPQISAPNLMNRVKLQTADLDTKGNEKS